jgi:hypothetical protein
MKRRVPLRRSEDGNERGDHLPLVAVSVRSRYGDFVPIRFCVDTGADLTAIPVPLAEEVGLYVPRASEALGTASGLVGKVNLYLGTVRLRIFGEEFTWPCAFTEATGPTSRKPYGVLGRAGLIAAFNVCIKSPFLTIERRRDHLPVWQRILLALVPSWPRLHPANRPL